MGWLSSHCPCPKTTLQAAGATARMPAFAFADMIQAATAQAMRLCCSPHCNGASARRVAGTRLAHSLGMAQPPTKSQVLWLARTLAWVLCSQDLHDWPTEVIHCGAQRTLRVSGAQMFAKANLDFAWAVGAPLQLFVTFKRLQLLTLLVQLLPFRTGPPCSPSLALHKQGLPPWPSCRPLWTRFVQWLLIVSEEGVLVHNVRSKLAHKPCATECSTPSSEWRSACGHWRYRKATCQRNPSLLPGFKHCPVCFPEKSTVAEVASPRATVALPAEASVSSSSE